MIHFVVSFPPLRSKWVEMVECKDVTGTRTSVTCADWNTQSWCHNLSRGHDCTPKAALRTLSRTFSVTCWLWTFWGPNYDPLVQKLEQLHKISFGMGLAGQVNPVKIESSKRHNIRVRGWEQFLQTEKITVQTCRVSLQLDLTSWTWCTRIPNQSGEVATYKFDSLRSTCRTCTHGPIFTTKQGTNCSLWTPCNQGAAVGQWCQRWGRCNCGCVLWYFADIEIKKAFLLYSQVGLNQASTTYITIQWFYVVLVIDG